MLNGHWQSWVDEARHQVRYILVAATALKNAFPMTELIRLAVVALVTAVFTSQVTMARLDERINAISAQRTLLVQKRDEQVTEMKRQDELILQQLNELVTSVALIKAKLE